MYLNYHNDSFPLDINVCIFVAIIRFYSLEFESEKTNVIVRFRVQRSRHFMEIKVSLKTIQTLIKVASGCFCCDHS